MSGGGCSLHRTRLSKNSLVSGNIAGNFTGKVTGVAANRPANTRVLLKAECSGQGMLLGGSGKELWPCSDYPLQVRGVWLRSRIRRRGCSSMRAARPTAWPTHPFLKLRAHPFDMLTPCLLFLDGDGPADPLVACERRYVFPCCSCLRVGCERRP